MTSTDTALEVEDKQLERQGTGLTNTQIIFIGFLVLMAFAIRLYRIDAQSLWWDETLSVHRASKDIAYIISNKIIIFDQVTIDQHPPLYFLLLHLFINAFGHSEFAVRFLSLASIVLAVPLSYKVGLQIHNRATGLFAALAAAISPFYLWYAQETRPYALVAMLTTLSTYLAIKLTRTRSKGLLLGYFLVTSALLSTHYLTAALVLAQVSYLFILAVRVKGMRSIIGMISLCTAGLVLVFEAPYALNRYLIQSGEALNVPIESVIRDIVVTFTFGVSIDQFDVIPFAAVISLTIVLVSVVGVRKRERGNIFLLWVCLVIPLAIIYLISLHKSVYGTRYVMFLAPIYYIILGYSAAQAYRLRPILGIVFGIAVLAAGIVGSYDYLMVNNNDKQDYRGTVEYIVQHSKPGDAIILNDQRIVTAFEYYYKDKSHLYPVPRFRTVDQNVISRDVRTIAEQHSRIWLVLSMSGDIDPNGLVEKTLGENYYQLDRYVLVGNTYSIATHLYSTAPYTVTNIPSYVVSKEMNFDNHLALIAYDIKRQDHPGNRLDVTLYWKTQKPELQRFAVFGQLVDSEGNVWGSFDDQPFKGFFSTDRWNNGSIVADQRELWITPGAPPGKYSLRLGVRSVDINGNRLRIVDKKELVRTEVGEIADVFELSAGIEGDSRTLVLPKYYNVTFDDRLTLLGSDLVSRNISPGEELSFMLFWRNKTTKLEELDIELWLVDNKGERLRIGTRPISSIYPPSSWRQGELVAAYYDFVVPATIKSSDHSLELRLVRRGSDNPIAARTHLNPFLSSSINLGTINIINSDRRFGIPSSISRVGANLDQKVELLGFDFHHTDSKTLPQETGSVAKIDIQTSGSGPIDIELWWKALSQMSVNYSITVQVLNSSGQLVDQHDGFPAEGRRPTAGWIEDEVIQDTHRLANLASLPKGQYTLIVAMYDPNTGERLSIKGELQDFIKVAEITVH